MHNCFFFPQFRLYKQEKRVFLQSAQKFRAISQKRSFEDSSERQPHV